MNDGNELVQCELKVDGDELVFTSPGRVMRLAKFYTERDAQFMADMLKLLEGKIK